MNLLWVIYIAATILSCIGTFILGLVCNGTRGTDAHARMKKIFQIFAVTTIVLWATGMLTSWVQCLFVLRAILTTIKSL